MSSRSRACSLFALILSFMSAGTMLGSGAAFATSDAVRNQLAKKRLRAREVQAIAATPPNIRRGQRHHDNEPNRSS